MLIYATENELAVWLTPDPVPANAAGLLRSASGLIRSETKRARYDTDTDGYPRDTRVREAFREATMAQAKFWADHKIDPSLGAAGVKPVAVSKSIGGASVQYEPGATAAKASAVAGLAPDAYYILDDAGLLSGVLR